MRSISIHEVFETGADGEPYVSGFMAHIEPPVNLAPATVEHYLRNGRLDASNPDADAGIANPMLVGNGENHTAIYASPEYYRNPDEVREAFAERVAGLLGHLGIESEITQ
jgi:hypothetical protein